jgi:hypothetical protein
MRNYLLITVLATSVLSVSPFPCIAKSTPDPGLKVIIIRHGEKPETGNNLSCLGENRALQLPKVLSQKFQQFNHTYVPSMKLDKSTSHVRMFQTVTPFAVKYNLKINSKYQETDFSKIAKSVMKKTGTVLMVWEHKSIPPLATSLGVQNPPDWKGSDFDSIWIITYPNGEAVLSFDAEGLTPSADCSY